MTRREGHIIDPKLISDVKEFEWIAKLLAHGFLHGKHHSSRLGSGMEFQQYRPYVQGDDIRLIDWKMFAKTDKYYIKETSIETEHQFAFILDLSASMRYTEKGWEKLLLGKLVIAAMTRVLANQGDYFSWRAGSTYFPSGSGIKHWQNGIELLYNLETNSDSEFNKPVQKVNKTFVWISDFYMSLEKIDNALKSLKNPRSEVIIFQILGEAEKFLDFGTNATFIDLETKEKLDVNTSKSRETYQRKLNKHLQLLKNKCFEIGAVYEEVLLNRPVSESIQKFFHHYQYQSI